MSSIQRKEPQFGFQAPDLMVTDREAAVEKRKETRIVTSVPATVMFYEWLDDDFHDYPVLSINVSSNGMCIETPRGLDKGRPVLIRVDWMNNLPEIDSTQNTAYHGDVRWCSRYRTVLGDTAYRSGIRFYEPSEMVAFRSNRSRYN